VTDVVGDVLELGPAGAGQRDVGRSQAVGARHAYARSVRRAFSGRGPSERSISRTTTRDNPKSRNAMPSAMNPTPRKG